MGPSRANVRSGLAELRRNPRPAGIGEPELQAAGTAIATGGDYRVRADRCHGLYVDLDATAPAFECAVLRFKRRRFCDGSPDHHSRNASRRLWRTAAAPLATRRLANPRTSDDRATHADHRGHG